ncbi:MAG TPA: tetratricopeptide repeat protein [Burkholderiales bacterium]|nr:tetratricopeptide repeat protein [Burkholderiales bacterium]
MLESILRARHCLSLGQLDAAEALVRENRDDADLLHILGVVCLRRGQPEAAEAALRRALERDASVAAYHNALGNALQDRGRLNEAIACYRRALRLHPGFAEAWNDLGTARYAKGDLDAARECYRQALRLRPDHAVAHANMGAACRKLGLLRDARRALQRELVLRLKHTLRSLLPRRLDLASAAQLAALARAHLDEGNARLALQIAAKALRLDARNAAALRVLSAAHLRQGRLAEALDAARESGDAHELGRALAAAGRIDEAAAAFDPALWLEPRDAALHVALGQARERRGERAQAESAYRRAIELDPLSLIARVRLSEVLRQADRLDEAEAAARAVLEVDDEAPAGHVVLGMAYKAKGQVKKARECFERALALKPGHPQAVQQLAHALREEDRLDDAERHLRAALRERPDDPALVTDLGMILADQMRYDEALERFERALEAAPQNVVAINRKALLLDHLGERARGLELLREALRLAPNDEFVHYTQYNLGLHHLKYGEFAAGWEGYEHRRGFENFIGRYRRFPLPQWDGEPLAGRNVLVLPEQGLGDEIMFGSCIPDLAAEAAHVIVECDPKLEAIFRRSFPACTVVSRQRTLANDWITRVQPKPELQVAAGSLARRYRSRTEDFPQRPFLQADPARVAAWKAKLEALGPGRKIGLSWRGGVGLTGRKRRSFSLGELAPVLRLPGTHWISLQYTDVREELRQLESRQPLKVHHWQEAIDDYGETAALVCALDGVLTVCTAIVHLSGALGRPAVVMVPFGADWRYGGEGERIVWYPSVRLVRQRRVGEWSDVLQEVSRRIGTGAWP